MSRSELDALLLDVFEKVGVETLSLFMCKVIFHVRNSNRHFIMISERQILIREDSCQEKSS